jgi:hypothetical protein
MDSYHNNRYKNKNTDCKNDISSDNDHEKASEQVPTECGRGNNSETEENTSEEIEKGECNTLEIIDIDEFLIRSNECGRYQIVIIVKMMLITFALAYTPFIFYFVGFDPHWIHVGNSTTHLREDGSRCLMNRSEWMYDYDKTSIVTEVLTHKTKQCYHHSK